MENEFDFGFTFGDTESIAPTPPVQIPEPTFDESVLDDFKEMVLSKLEDLDDKLSSLLTGDIQAVIEQHKELVTTDVQHKLEQVEQLILPLLYNLKKNPDKEYIHWPNRTEIIDKQIQKILHVTRSYGQNA